MFFMFCCSVVLLFVSFDLICVVLVVVFCVLFVIVLRFEVSDDVLELSLFVFEVSWVVLLGIVVVLVVVLCVLFVSFSVLLVVLLI